MTNHKHLTYALIFAVQVFILPAFFGFNLNAKFILFAFASIGLLLCTDFKRIQTPLPLTLVGLFAALLLTSCLTAYHLPTALAGGGVLLLLLLYGIFYLPRVFPRGLDQRFLALFLLFIVLVSALGLYEYCIYLHFGTTSEQLIPYLLPPKKSARLGGLFGQPNLYALLLLLGMLVFVYQHLHGRLLWRGTRRMLQPLRYLPLLLTGLAFFLTGSRAGLLALLVSLLLLALFSIQKGVLQKRSGYRGELIRLAGVLLLAYCGYRLLDANLQVSLARSFTTPGLNADTRYVFWLSALLMLRDHPWFGIGLDNYKFFLPGYVNEAHSLLGFVEYEAMGSTKWAHNELLQLFGELGGVAGLLIALLLCLYLLRLYQIVSGRRACSWRLFFAYLFLLPMIVQSMFSWPLRHPALLVLFVSFCGSLLALQPGVTVSLNRAIRSLFKAALVLLLLGVVYVGTQEVRLGRLFDSFDADAVPDSYPAFQKLAADPYAEIVLLRAISEPYARWALDYQDIDFAEQILPYHERLVELFGANWQWYNLARIYHLLGRHEDAVRAVKMAIELRPMELLYWDFLHALNVERASQITGRPVSDFETPPEVIERALKALEQMNVSGHFQQDP